jgi:hypothetical protein
MSHDNRLPLRIRLTILLSACIFTGYMIAEFAK